MSVPEITVEELDELGTTNIMLVDVREPDEYAAGRVPGAVLIPLATVPDRTDEIPKDSTVYLICASGGRSMNAAEYLDANGWDTVNISGGTKAWIAFGKPVDQGAVDAG